MRDDFTYDPPLIEIVPEEVVEFQISNEGGVVHEFLVGDEARQAESSEKWLWVGTRLTEPKLQAFRWSPARKNPSSSSSLIKKGSSSTAATSPVTTRPA